MLHRVSDVVACRPTVGRLGVANDFVSEIALGNFNRATRSVPRDASPKLTRDRPAWLWRIIFSDDSDEFQSS